MRSKYRTLLFSIHLGSFLFLTCHLIQAQPPEPEEGIRWILNEQFSDEFNDTVLDLNKWYNYHPWWKGRPPAAFLPSQVSLRDGNLVIKNKKLAQDTVIGGTTFSIAGGAVCSRSSSASYGYYEVSMKASKIRMSSTFWMSNRGAAGPDPCSGDRYSLELDIQEAVGGITGTGMEKFRNSMNSNTHYWYTDCNGERNIYSAGSTIPANRELSDTFFVYAAHWVNASKVKLYLNGVQGNTVNFRTDITENPFDRPMQINMVTETYDWVNPPTAEDLADDSRNTTYYDWIRSYRNVPVDYTQTPSELVINGGFETGDFTYWTGWGGNPLEVVSNNQYSGNYCVHIGGPGAPEYEVNLKPGTTYTVSCYGKVVAGSGPIYLGIKDINSLTYGSAMATDTNYTKLSFDFTTGSETSLKFYYYAQNTGDEGYADDFELVEKDGSGDDGQKETVMFNEKIYFSETPAEKTAGQTVDFLITYMANADRELNLQLFNPDSVLIGRQKYLALAGFGKKRYIMQLDSVPQQGNDYFLMADIRPIDSSFADTFQTAIYRFDLLNSVDVSITTLDLRDDSPVQETAVMVGDSTKITDAYGIAYFIGVSPGTLTIQGEKEGFVDYSSEFQSIRSDTSLIIRLTPVSYKTTIIVSNKYTGEPLEYASINVDGKNILTDHNGRAVQYLFSGNYPILVSLERYADKALSVDISQDTVIYIDMDQTLADVKFVVKLDSSNLAGASITIAGNSELTSSIGMANFYDLKTDTAYVYRIEHNTELLMEDTVVFRADTTLRLYINTAVNSSQTRGNNYQLYPNPAHSDIRVSGISGSIEFSIRDIQGRTLKTGQVENEGIIDLSSLSEGVYMLELKGFDTMKFAVRR